jgi:lauroyl/myristoyl acyltransferase
VLSWLDVAEAAAIAQRIAEEEAMQRVLAKAVRWFGTRVLRDVVAMDAGVAGIRGPAILTLFHAGALHAVGSALERLPVPVLAFRQGVLARPRGSLQSVTELDTEAERAAAFHRALVHLRGGGVVAMTADLAPGASIDVPLFGATLHLARGPFALARLTGAPLVPVAVRREGDRIVVSAAEPIAGGDERAMAVALAAWLEAWLRERPADLSIALVNELLRR